MGYKDVNVIVGGNNNNYPQTYKTVILKPSIPLGEQLVDENTIYVVKWDFEIGMNKIYAPLDFSSGGTMVIDGVTYYWSILVSGGDDTTFNLCDNTVFFCNLNSDVLILDRSVTLNKDEAIRIASPLNTYHEKAYYTEANAVVIPENCVLKFEGGSLNNGAIIGNATQIIAQDDVIFTGIIIDGTWNVPEIKSSWFGDCRNNNVVKQLINLSSDTIHNRIYIGEGEYYVSAYESDPLILQLKSNTELNIAGTIQLNANSLDACTIIGVYHKTNVVIKGGSIIGDRDTHLTEIEGQGGAGIEVKSSRLVTISDIRISSCYGDCVYVGNTSSALIPNTDVILKNLILDNSSRQGISVTHGENIKILHCKITNVRGVNPQAGIDVEPNTNLYCKQITIENCFIDCASGIHLYASPVNNPLLETITVRNNEVITRGKYPFSIRNAHNVLVENNTFKCMGTPMEGVENAVYIRNSSNFSSFSNRYFIEDEGIGEGHYIYSLFAQTTNNSVFINDVFEGNKDLYLGASPLKISKCVVDGNVHILRSDTELQYSTFNGKILLDRDTAKIRSTNCAFYGEFVNNEHEGDAYRLTSSSMDNCSFYDKVEIEGTNVFFSNCYFEKEVTFSYLVNTFYTNVEFKDNSLLGDFSHVVNGRFDGYVDAARNSEYVNCHFTGSSEEGENSSLIRCGRNNVFVASRITLDDNEFRFFIVITESPAKFYGCKFNGETQEDVIGGSGKSGAILESCTLNGDDYPSNSGEFADRPTAGIYAGFKYMIVENSPERYMPIYYGGNSKWYDAMGTEVTV